MRLLRRNAPLHIAFLALALVAVAAYGSTTSSADDATSISGAGSGNWTTPQVGSDFDYARTAAPRYMLQEAPRPAAVPSRTYYGVTSEPLPVPAPLPGSALSSGPRWAEGTITTVPTAEVSELAASGAESYAEWPTDVTTEMAPDVIAAPAPAAPAIISPPAATAGATAGQRVPVNPCNTYSGCGLTCMQSISEWHVRAIGGVALFSGDDPPDDCGYAGLDIGRTFCGCWGLDLYYRWNSGRFQREGFVDGNGNQINKDGGDMHHVGLKFTWERGFSRDSRWYFWTGIGGGYYWTDGYLDDDKGAEVFGEAGVGFMISRNLRLRAGVGVHGMDTSVGRKTQTNFGKSRMLWVIAPQVGLEFTF